LIVGANLVFGGIAFRHGLQARSMPTTAARKVDRADPAR
jgi:hypothetical protein